MRFGRLLDGQAEHHTCGEVDEVYLKNLGHEREASRCAEVAFNNLDVVVLWQGTGC